MLRGVVFSARQAVLVPVRGESGVGLAAEFARAAHRYWLRVFPRVCREVGGWRIRAGAIPSPGLRRCALENLQNERLNLDGAAAFAAFAPTVRRPMVVRAQVAFQAAYDYVDSLAEQDNPDPVRNGDQLHRALVAALDPALGGVDYYTHHRDTDDGGYLDTLVESCRLAVGVLPSFAAVAASARRAATRIVAYQSLNQDECGGGHGGLERWARANDPDPGGDLRWWEIAASAGSSLGVFVLIAAAAEQGVCAEEAAAIERAYFPWVGSLHTLLDSLVDRHEDATAGRVSLVDYYGSPRGTATCMAHLAVEALAQAASLPHGRRHMLVLTGMASHYLSAREALLPDALLATRSVLAAIGGLAAPTMFVMGTRRVAGGALGR